MTITKLGMPEHSFIHFVTVRPTIPEVLLTLHSCLFQQEQVMSFLSNIFSFHCCRYTTVEHLAEDIMKQFTVRIDNTILKLSERNRMWYPCLLKHQSQTNILIRVLKTINRLRKYYNFFSLCYNICSFVFVIFPSFSCVCVVCTWS